MFNIIKVSVISFVSLFLCASCTTTRVIGNTRNPEVEIESSGIIWVGDRQVKVGKVGKMLRSEGFERTQQVKVLVSNKNDRHLMTAVKSDLRRSGFTRVVFITNKITESTTKNE